MQSNVCLCSKRNSNELSAMISKDILYPAIKKPSCRVMLIGGPPGSGKSYYVDKNKKQGDIVIDLDDIMSELSGLPIYQADKDTWIIPALKERNKRLSSLCNENINRVAWVIICASGTQWSWWRMALKPKTAHSCWMPMDVCINRIKADQRRSHQVDKHIKVCVDWFEAEQRSIQKACGCRAED